MEAADVLIKYARDEAGGSNWNPALHPRAGTPPNPGWFAPTGGAAAGETAATVTAAIKSPAEAWKAGWAARGRYFDQLLGANLHPNFPVIDKFAAGVATSIKSIDLTAATYQSAARLTSRLNKYVDDLEEFDGAEFAGDQVKSIVGRTLSLAIPRGSTTAI